MQVTVESTGTLGRRMTVAVPAARLEQEVVPPQAHLPDRAFPRLPPRQGADEDGRGPVRRPGHAGGDRRPDPCHRSMRRVNRAGSASRPAARTSNRATSIAARTSSTRRPSRSIRRSTHCRYPRPAHRRPAVTVAGEDVERTINTLRQQRDRLAAGGACRARTAIGW
ncbi:MAG: hypothetical protein MZW92_29025 [Comamonadaceae bacterium]|nr:hypothetical protein [Comamonadaceae bacterium]